MEPSTTYSTSPTQNQRPTFLTVLCILTFLSCAWGLINSVTTYSSADLAASVTQESLEEASSKIEDEGSAAVGKIFDSITESLSPEKIRQSAIAKGIFNLLTLLGAALMFNLRRTGFYVYVAGVVVAIVAPIFIYGGFVGGVASAGTAFISIIFVVLYALNLKYLR